MKTRFVTLIIPLLMFIVTFSYTALAMRVTSPSVRILFISRPFSVTPDACR